MADTVTLTANVTDGTTVTGGVAEGVTINANVQEGTAVTGAVVTGAKGDKGDKGDAGTTDYNQLTNKPDLTQYATTSYVDTRQDKNYTQAFTALSTVTVTHNLGKRPAVTVMDSAGDECEGDITHVDTNSLTVKFSAPFTGTVLCN